MNTLKRPSGRLPHPLLLRHVQRVSNCPRFPLRSNRRLVLLKTHHLSVRHARRLCVRTVGVVDANRVNNLGHSHKNGCVTIRTLFQRTVSSIIRRVCVVLKDCFTIVASQMVTKVVRTPHAGATQTKGWHGGVVSPPFPSFFRVYGYIGRLEGVSEWWRRVTHATRELVVGVGLLFLRPKRDCWIQVVRISSARFDCLYVPIIFLTLLKY